MAQQTKIPMASKRRLAVREAFARLQHPEPDADQGGGRSDRDADNGRQRMKLPVVKRRRFPGM